MRVVVVCNESAGEAGPSPERISAAFEASGVRARVVSAPPSGIAAAAKEALEGAPEVVAAAGGDGTVRAVAGALLGSASTLGVLPTGTWNHFARDLGIPLDLEQAAATIARGPGRWVDVGEVNGYVFLNNSSLGLYPHVARHRAELRSRHGHGWFVGTLRAGVQVLRHNPSVAVRVAPAAQEVHRTPFVFVGNNGYEMRLFRLGRRRRLDGGQLEVYLSRRHGRAALFRLATRALLGRLEQARDFKTFRGEEFTIESGRSVHHVALDGEVVRLSPPLRYRIRPRALRVRAP